LRSLPRAAGEGGAYSAEYWAIFQLTGEPIPGKKKTVPGENRRGGSKLRGFQGGRSQKQFPTRFPGEEGGTNPPVFFFYNAFPFPTNGCGGLGGGVGGGAHATKNNATWAGGLAAAHIGMSLVLADREFA